MAKRKPDQTKAEPTAQAVIFDAVANHKPAKDGGVAKAIAHRATPVDQLPIDVVSKLRAEGLVRTGPNGPYALVPIAHEYTPGPPAREALASKPQ